MLKRRGAKWLASKWFDLRAARYLSFYPNDYLAVRAIKAGRSLGARTARHNAELTSGLRISDMEWASFGGSWERAWTRLVR